LSRDEGLTFSVRTVNTWSRGPDYAARLARIAAKLYADTPGAPGLIALQEVARPLRWPWSRDGATLLARSLEALHGAPLAHCRAGDLGIVAGAEWRLVAQRSWLLGRDAWLHDPGTIPYRRYLLEAELEVPRPEGQGLRDSATGRRVRFYNTHLSHGSQEEQRLRQTRRLIEVVRGRATPGELPPLLAGDFNAGPGSEVWGLLEEHFALLHADRVDAVWAGRGSSYPHARGAYTVEATAVVPLIAEGLCDAHDAPRVTLLIQR
jgi:endonuclease/exonuclease/phosphatase family metal-dependent hydrolase